MVYEECEGMRLFHFLLCIWTDRCLGRVTLRRSCLPFEPAPKEMTLLPLPYRKVFQYFGFPPPHDIQLHSPPGTGKPSKASSQRAAVPTAKAFVSLLPPMHPPTRSRTRLWPSCVKAQATSSNGSAKPNGQLCFLFEEAYPSHSQPSTIFFDEIDGPRARALLQTRLDSR